MSISNDKLNRIKGALYGFAIGDAMGATNEFRSKYECQRNKVTHIIGGGWLGLKPGDVTDDTQMMLCVFKGIMDGAWNDGKLQLIANNFSKWYDSKPADVGKQCGYVISKCRHKNFKVWEKVAENDSAFGNGSLMRALPAVLLSMSSDFNTLQGALTHNNMLCATIITMYHEQLKDLINLGEFKGDATLCEQMQPTGHIINTYSNANFWFRSTNNFMDGMLESVNDGGDADTISAIYGSIAGAYYGFDKIPTTWVSELSEDVKIELENILNFLKKF